MENDVKVSAETPNSGEPKKPEPGRRSFRKKLHKFFVRVWFPIVAVFILYTWYSYRATGFDPRILTSDQHIVVTDESGAITFVPTATSKHAGLVFIPGALVEPVAYAPLAHSIAEAGYPVTIIKLPFRYAPFQSHRNAVIARVVSAMNSGTSGMRWVLAGHSYGGVLASSVASNPPKQLHALVLMGTSHPRDVDLSASSLDITKLTATNDGLASPTRVQANAGKLPAQTHWITIEGGNHSQFGYYGFQTGDHRATIPRSKQQEIISQSILDALSRVSVN